MKLKSLISSVCLLALSHTASAGIIDADSVLLDDAGATQLESWLGLGDLDWDSIWYGEIGNNASTSQSWHEAVDGVGPTVSIYSVTNYLNEQVLIGGYTEQDWSGSGYRYDSNAFLFNLSTGEMQTHRYSDGSNAIYTNSGYFATFGGGHDLTAHSAGNVFYTFSYTYDITQGRIDVFGDSGSAYGGVGSFMDNTVHSLQTFTFSTAGPSVPSTDVPEPSSLAIFAAGLLGLLRIRAKKA